MDCLGSSISARVDIKRLPWLKARARVHCKVALATKANKLGWKTWDVSVIERLRLNIGFVSNQGTVALAAQP